MSQVVHGTVPVSYHTFWLAERTEPTPAPGPRPSNGLVTPHTGAVEIWAGTHTGSVPITVETRGDAPDEDDTAEWDDVVELDVDCLHGALHVTSFFAHLRRELPNLTSAGAGVYRIRFSARGRDSGEHYDMPVPAEEWKIVSWPAAGRNSERILKQTDRYGRMLRGEV